VKELPTKKVQENSELQSDAVNAINSVDTAKTRDYTSATT